MANLKTVIQSIRCGVTHKKVTIVKVLNFLERKRYLPYTNSGHRNFCSYFNCWNCSKVVSSRNEFFCGKCGKLLEARADNYFKLMAIDEKFDLNINDLTKKYREFQALVHPDKYSNRDEKERKNSMEWSSLLNKAYKILSGPLERGEYILNQKGIFLPHDNSILDHDFLLEIMERNEEIEHADHKSMHVHLAKTRSTLNNLSKSVGDLLKKGNYDEAKHVLVKMKYYKSLERAIKAKLQKMELNLL